MNRRRFLTAAGVAPGGLAGTFRGQAEIAGVAPHRSSRLFDPFAGEARTMVQSLVFWDGRIYCLYYSMPGRRAGFSVTMPDGATVWQQELPPARYLSFGLQGGNAILVAESFPNGAGGTLPNALVRLPPDGATVPLTSLTEGFTGRLVFGGDSTFLRIDANYVDVWRLDGSDLHRSPGTPPQPWYSPAPAARSVSPEPNVDLLSADLAAMTPADGSGIASVNLKTGAVEQHAIACPDVAYRVAVYQTPPDPRLGIIPATGPDGAGTLYALLVPAFPTNIPVIRLSPNGDGAVRTAIQVDRKLGFKLLVSQGELGLASGDGAVRWYPAA